MVSIITPVFNAQKFIDQCIQSVLAQTYSDWELLLVNDGSIDSSKEIMMSYSDPRIRFFDQKNLGVSSARNLALRNMNGDFFCFLDADDSFPRESLSSRVKVFEENLDIDFVDGIVLKMNTDMNKVKKIIKPRFEGDPLKDLVHLTGKSFIGLTWMIRKGPNFKYKFREDLSHGEDLLFFMELTRLGGNYAFVETPILHYRDTEGSAMKSIEKLEKGYRTIENEIKNWKELSSIDRIIYMLRWRKFMVFDYSKRGEISKLIDLFRIIAL